LMRSGVTQSRYNMVIEVRVRNNTDQYGQPELLRCLLVKAGIPVERIVEKNEKGRVSVSVFFDSAGKANQAVCAMRRLRLKNISISVIPLKDSDWKTRWKKYVKPFAITRDIRIIPVWAKSLPPRGAGDITIDTTSAFGTGLHATTRMMAGFLKENKEELESFLDVGTGSGILSLIACCYGAKDIWAIDHDKAAIATARKNFQTNKCRASRILTADIALFKPGRRFDFVAANLFTEDLVRLRRKLVSLVRPGGLLAVSGIFHENYPSFRRRFKAAGLRRVKSSYHNKWYAVLFKKNGGSRE
jgi:ribosomal protein L11 methyltransferase